MLKTLTEEFLITASQTDLNARLRPGALLEMMQEMAGNHAEKLEIGRDKLLADNLVWVLTRLEVRMQRWPRFSERITIEPPLVLPALLYFPRRDRQRNRLRGEPLGAAGHPRTAYVQARSRYRHDS